MQSLIETTPRAKIVTVTAAEILPPASSRFPTSLVVLSTIMGITRLQSLLPDGWGLVQPADFVAPLPTGVYSTPNARWHNDICAAMDPQ
jgi:hypothetical protein